MPTETPKDVRRPSLDRFCWDAERALDGRVLETIHELSNQLIVTSELVRRVRDAATDNLALGGDARKLDQAFGEIVALVRRVGERLQAENKTEAYTSVSRAVQELAVIVGGCLPPGISLSVRCCDSPVVVAASRTVVLRALVALAGAAMTGLHNGGVVRIEVAEEPAAPPALRFVRVEVGGSGGPREAPPAARALAGAVGGAVVATTKGPLWTGVLRLPTL
jgi:hypothetical protein